MRGLRIDRPGYVERDAVDRFGIIPRDSLFGNIGGDIGRIAFERIALPRAAGADMAEDVAVPEPDRLHRHDRHGPLTGAGIDDIPGWRARAAAVQAVGQELPPVRAHDHLHAIGRAHPVLPPVGRRAAGSGPAPPEFSTMP